VRVACEIGLTACLGSFSVTLLAFEPSNLARFPGFLASLVGLG
jgi:hypothetical protein